MCVGKSCLATAFGSLALIFEVLHSHSSIFLLLPFGAGSSGVREYVTVLVTT